MKNNKVLLFNIILVNLLVLANICTFAQTSEHHSVEVRSDEVHNSYLKCKAAAEAFEKDQEWKVIDGNFFVSKNNDTAFRIEHLEHGILFKLYVPIHTGKYFDSDERIVEGIDMASFQKVNDKFYKDKNKVYMVRVLLGVPNYVCNFEPFDNSDPASFEILSSCYAKDKNKIYSVAYIFEIDYQTFITSENARCIGIDKNSIFQNGYIVDLDSYNEQDEREKTIKSEIIKIVAELKNQK